MTTPESSTATRDFLNTVMATPWGAVSKSELEFLVFELLVADERVKLSQSDTAISGVLRTTPARVRALRFRYQQRQGASLDATVLLANMKAYANGSDDRVLVTIDRVYLMGLLVDEMKTRGFLVQRELTSGIIRVSLLDLFETLAALGTLKDVDGVDLIKQLNELRAAQRKKKTKTSLKVSAKAISEAAQGVGAGTALIAEIAKLVG